MWSTTVTTFVDGDGNRQADHVPDPFNDSSYPRMTTALSVAFVGLLARVGEFMSLPLPSDPDSEKVATILLGTVPDLVNLFRAIVVSHRLNSSSSSWSSSVESMPREAALCYSSCEYVRCSIFGGGCWGNGNNRNRAATCVATALARPPTPGEHAHRTKQINCSPPLV